EGVVQSDGDGGGGGVAVAVEVHHELGRRDAQLREGGVDDTLVDLVRDDQGEVPDGQAAVGHRLLGQLADGAHGEPEDLAAVHAQEGVLARGGDVGGGRQRPAVGHAGNADEVAAAAVGVEPEGVRAAGGAVD